MYGRIDSNITYSTKINDDLTASSNVSLYYYPMGYVVGSWGWFPAGINNDANTHRLAIDESYIRLTSQKYGTVTLGNILYTPYIEMIIYSYVGYFISIPANLVPNGNFFTSFYTNGIKYKKSFVNDKLTVELFAQPGHKSTPFKVMQGVNLYRNAGYSADVQYKITNDIRRFKVFTRRYSGGYNLVLSDF